jgi:hypothetical protein
VIEEISSGQLSVYLASRTAKAFRDIEKPTSNQKAPTLQTSLVAAPEPGPRKLMKKEKVEIIRAIAGKSQVEAERELADRIPVARKPSDRPSRRVVESKQAGDAVGIHPHGRRVGPLGSNDGSSRGGAGDDESTRQPQSTLFNTEQTGASGSALFNTEQTAASESVLFNTEQTAASGSVLFNTEQTQAHESNEEDIPAQTQRRVFIRNDGACQYPVDGGRSVCGRTHAVDIDHIRPRSEGGGSEISNLRVLCRAHNRNRQWIE